ncbi:MAG: hypothetical protein K1Y36_05080 [Blastocatellia bacterium]|nr:hypothetical protein [Blastocatellia bacterium]
MSDSSSQEPKYRYNPLRDCWEPAETVPEKAELTSSLTAEEQQQVAEWKAQETAEQEERFQKILAAMEALTEQRDQWAEDFLDRITWRGYSVHNGIRRKIKKEDLPKKRRPIRPVW